jgi:hypothetical protein
MQLGRRGGAGRARRAPAASRPTEGLGGWVGGWVVAVTGMLLVATMHGQAVVCLVASPGGWGGATNLLLDQTT